MMALDDPQGIPTQPLSEDLMIGAVPIASWLGVPPRKLFYMAETKQLPLFKIGGKLAGRKSTITRHFAALEQAGKAEVA
jgi:hypothetical protein